VDVLTPETAIPIASVVSIVLMAVGGARLYEALRSTQNTQGQDVAELEKRVDKMGEGLAAVKDQQDRRHEVVVHRISIIESREAVHDQRMAGVEDHLRQQDKKLDKIDDKLDRALMRDDHPRRRKDDAA
jgi:uncharacterized coiled-coil protein SlyX